MTPRSPASLLPCGPKLAALLLQQGQGPPSQQAMPQTGQHSALFTSWVLGAWQTLAWLHGHVSCQLSCRLWYQMLRHRATELRQCSRLRMRQVRLCSCVQPPYACLCLQQGLAAVWHMVKAWQEHALQISVQTSSSINLAQTASQQQIRAGCGGTQTASRTGVVWLISDHGPCACRSRCSPLQQ